MTTLELKLSLSDEVLEYLRQEAGKRNVSLDTVVSELLADYFEEPDEAHILTSIKRGMKQALAGQGRPAHEVLDEIEEEFGEDGN